MLSRTMMRRPMTHLTDKMDHLRLLPHAISSHQKQLRSLIRNSVEYSRKCQKLPARHEFKVSPSLKALKKASQQLLLVINKTLTPYSMAYPKMAYP